MRRAARLALALATLVAVLGSLAPAVAAPDATQDSRFGIAHVVYGDGSTPPFYDRNTRLAQAAQAGAGWDRWALYWSDVETTPGVYNFTTVDTAVAQDRANGLRVNAVLANTPAAQSTASSAGALGAADVHPTLAPAQPRIDDKSWLSARLLGREPAATQAVESNPYIAPPKGLYEKVFSDGTDTPGPGKAINQNNPWARFVYTTVTRYRGQVDLWEMRNEPDRPDTWSGSVADYVRVLKVGYLAAKAADPSARVAAGGIAYWGNPGWLEAMLDQIKGDPSAAANGYYFDVYPFHWYSRSSDVYDKTVWARQKMAARGITGKEIWVNESNVPVCGESTASPPPQAVSCNRDNWFGSGSEQAAYIVQSFAYALAADVKTLITFQQYDDRNEFMYGLRRNDGSARPSVTAYQTAATYLAGATSAPRTTTADYERIDVQTNQADTVRLVSVVWKRTPGDGTFTVPGSGSATLVSPDGATSQITAGSDGFAVWLPGATAYYQAPNSSSRDYFIGGSPRLIVRVISQPDSGGLIANGNFEDGIDCTAGGGPTAWTCFGAGTGKLSESVRFSGRRSLQLDGSSFGNSVYQTVQVPPNGDLRLRFAYRIVTQGDPANRLEVYANPVADSWPVVGTPLFAAADYTDWRTASVDLSRFAGQQVYIAFNAKQNADQIITGWIDAVSLWPYRSFMPIMRR